MEENKKSTNFFAKVGGAIATAAKAVWSAICKACKAVIGFFKKIEWKKTVNPIVAYSVFGGVCVISLVLFLVFCL